MRVLSAAVLTSLLAFGSVAHAETKICVVDAEAAMNGTAEGKAAQRRLETMYSDKQTEIDEKGKSLEKEFQDYEARKMILSDEARATEEQALWEKRQSFQAMVMQAEQEMQQTYMGLLAELEEKLLKVAEELGAQKGCSVLLQKAAVIYVGDGVTDLTDDLVKTYDAK